MALVKKAVEAAGRATAEIDEFWCLFDVEAPRPHPDLTQATALARRKGVKVAISNPSFELWLALHFEDRSGWLDTKAAERIRHNHDGSRDKGVDGATYMPLRKKAARRARRLAEMHERKGTRFPIDNPSSGMYRFPEAVDNH